MYESDDSDDEMLVDNSVLKWMLLSNAREFDAHPINKKRNHLGEFHHLYQELRIYPDRFFKYLRMLPETFDYILKAIRPNLQKNWRNWHTQPIMEEERLVVTLRYLATGASFSHLAFEFRMGVSTVGNIVKETVKIIWSILQPLHMPQPTSAHFKKVAEDFYNVWNFPNCMGGIDGKHVRIICPKHSGSMYFNYKHFYSIVLQAVADANYRFIIIDVGGYGKQSDGGTFRASQMFNLLERNQLNIPVMEKLPNSPIVVPYVFIADDAYPLMTNLMKPYPGDHLDSECEQYNMRLSRARKSVECAFGILYSKWRLISKAIETSEGLVDDLIRCMCLLQNIIIDKEGFERHLSEVVPIPPNVNMSFRRSAGREMNQAKAIRDSLKNFLCENQFRFV